MGTRLVSPHILTRLVLISGWHCLRPYHPDRVLAMGVDTRRRPDLLPRASHNFQAYTLSSLKATTFKLGEALGSRPSTTF